MSGNSDQIIMTLFGTGKLEEVPIEELKDLVKTYPSFNIGHYLLSKRLDKENNDDSIAANCTTALYFNNPFWLQWLLQNSNLDSLPVTESEAIFSHETRGSYHSAYPETSLPEEKEEFSIPVLPDRETILFNQPVVEADPPEEIIQETLIAEPSFHQDISPQTADFGETNQPFITQDAQPIDQIKHSEQESSPVFIPPSDSPFMKNEHNTEAPSDPILLETMSWIESPDPATNFTSGENEELTRIEEENQRLEREWQEAALQLKMLEERATVLRQFDPPSPAVEPKEIWLDEPNPSAVQPIEEAVVPPLTETVDQANSSTEAYTDAPRTAMVDSVNADPQEIQHLSDSISQEVPVDHLPDSGSPQMLQHDPSIEQEPDLAERPDSAFRTVSSIGSHLEEQEESQNPISILYEESTSVVTDSTSEWEGPAPAVSEFIDDSLLEQPSTDMPSEFVSARPEQELPVNENPVIEDNATVGPIAQPDEKHKDEQVSAIQLESPPFETVVAGLIQENPAGAAPDTAMPIAMNDQEQPAQESSIPADARSIPPESPINEKETKADQPKFATLPVTEEAPIFDPYHTIDYFASQGIKFVYQENPNDKFGKQLKSFTDWLKIMKRLPQKQMQATIEQSMDTSSIESFAAHSLDEKDTLTETMAAVLVKQGKYDKAIEIYQKLSLLNPAKNAYFAAKIDELKTY